MADKKPFYRCTACEWLGTFPQHIKSLKDMPICPECNSESVRADKGYEDYDEHRDAKRSRG